MPGLPQWSSGTESTGWCRGHRLDLWSWKIPHVSRQLSPCATTTEPARPRVHAPNKSYSNESLHTTTREQPPLLTTRESPGAATKTVQSKKQKDKNLKNTISVPNCLYEKAVKRLQQPSAKPRRDKKKQVGKIFPFAYLNSSLSPTYFPLKHWHSQLLDSPLEGKQKSEYNGLVFLPKGLISVLSDSMC